MFALTLTIAAAAALACEEAYEPPCGQTDHEVVISEPAVGGGDSIELQRSRDRVIATWPVRELKVSPDAGPPSLSLTAFGVAVLDAAGDVVQRRTVTAPSALRSRLGSVEQPGVSIEDGAALVHWTERSIATDPDGRIRTTATLNVAYEGSDAVLSPPGAACEMCTIHVSFASLGDETIAFLRMGAESVSFGTLGGSATTRFPGFRFRRDGTVAILDTSWLVLPRPILPPPPGFESEAPTAGVSLSVDHEGRLALRTDGYAWLLNREGLPLHGPVALPAAKASIAWGPSGDASIAWTAAGELGSRDLFIGLVPAGARTFTARERVSTGDVVQGADRRGEEVGLAFESLGRTFFAIADSTGKKRGGDLLLEQRPAVAQRASATTGELPAVQTESASIVIASGAGRFTFLRGGAGISAGTLSRSKVSCAR